MPTTYDEPVAIVGIGLRLPGANDTPDGLTEFLRAGRSGLGPIPTDRWDPEGLTSDDPDAKGTMRCAQGGFLDRPDHFDAKFYNISPKEADYIDPQQRLALEVAWEALEDAGIDPTGLRHGDGAVYVAVSNMDYAAEMMALPVAELNGYIGTGMAHSAVSGRISYFLGWRGPSITVDTACSASLVAVHLAARALRSGECGIALAGGVNTIHSPRGHIIASQSKMLAPDGICKTFDDSADGYCRSEGGAMIALKRLSDAQRDGDRVYAVVRGSAVGQDGESSALMVPNGAAQESVMRRAIDSAALTPSDISYVEAHGTGTSLGDPIEMGAISSVFGVSHSPDSPVTVASLKTNLGHMEAAAGIGGLVKTALQLREATIFPHLNFTTPSRQIPWDTAPVTVPTTLRPWKAATRRGVVNSFGFAGTIASVVLEEAPAEPPVGTDGRREVPPGPHVFALSAKTAPALRGQIQRYQELLADRPELDVGELCAAVGAGRAHFPLRVAGVVRDQEDVARLLDRSRTRAARTGRNPDTAKVAFLFSGGGSQYVGMGRPLYERFEVFRDRLDTCDRLFSPHLGRSLRDMILGDAEDAELIHEIRYMQPALFSLEYAVAELWMSWGITPSVVAGHSIGEIVAATVAGVFGLEDAVTLMAARGELMHESPPGAMAAVEATTDEVAPLLAERPDLSLAAVNGTNQMVISGGEESLARVVEVLAARGIRTKRLAVSCASHSPLMAEAAERLREVVAGLTFHEPRFTLVSNLTGAVAAPGELASADFWARHLLEPVMFADGLRAVAARGRHAFVEIGPATDLIGMGKQCLPADEHLWLSSLHPEDTDGTVVRQSLAQLYVSGAPVDWTAHHGRPRRTITLPTYAFDRRRHWLPEAAAAPQRTGGDTHPLLGREITTDGQRAAGTREFTARLGAGQPAYLADHKVMGKIVFPGAGYLEILLALRDAVHGESGLPLTGVTIHEALFLDESATVEIRTRLSTREDGTAGVDIVSLAGTGDGDRPTLERLHVTATIATDGHGGGGEELAATERELRGASDAAGTPRAEHRADDLYAEFAELGVDYGPGFRGLEHVGLHGDDLVVGRLRGVRAAPAELLPPAVLDCAFQTLAALSREGDAVAMPVGFRRCRLLRKPRGAELRSVLRRAPVLDPDDLPRADLLILDGDRTVFVLEGLALRRVTNAAPDRERMYSEVRWVKRSLRTENREPRRVLLVGAGRESLDELAGAAAGQNTELTVAADAAQALALLADRPTDVCWFWRGTGSVPDGGDRDAAGLRAECERNYRDLLALRDGLDAARFGGGQRLWLITEGGQWVPGDSVWDTGTPPAAATLWGFGQVMWTEYPAYRVTLVDLPGGGRDLSPLLAEWSAPDSAEYQIAYRSGLRHVRRVYAETGGPRTDVELVVKEYGRLDGIVPVPLQEAPAPEGDEIQVRVHAAGLNFKDVLNALGLHREHAKAAGLDDTALPLGLECAGVVTAAGPDAEFSVGDEVVLAHPGCLSERVTCASAMAARKPAHLSFAEAAALPTAFLTAYHGLHHLAGIKPGDRVLIHAAAGGVGQAAVQLAKLAGAEIFATASPHKWPLLRSQGVTRLANSRTPEIADEILAATGGAGVDIVLNSLAQEFIEESVRALADGGRFVELGTMSAWTAQEMHRKRPDVTYHTVDFGVYDPAQAQQLARDVLGGVMEMVNSRELTPIPTTAYTLDEVEEAFGVLSRGANIGKVVIGFGEPAPEKTADTGIRPDETYLVTGGFGALGGVVAERLVHLGARHLALVGRRAPAPEALDALRERLGPGTEITTLTGDIGDPDDVRRITAVLGALPQPLGGVVHAAGVLADAPVTAQTWENIDTVFRSKVYGSWLLHRATEHFPSLRFFVGYSSVASVVGSRGQANYAAGNSFLDTLMCRRRTAGLPALSVNWGAWGDIGLASGMEQRHIANVEDQGFSFFGPTVGIRALFRVLDRPVAQIVIAEVDWDRYSATRPQPNALYLQVGRRTADVTVHVDPQVLLALPRGERLEAVSEVLRGAIADLLHFDGADDVPPDARFFEVGLDSLAAVELKNRLELQFRVPLSTSSVFDHPSVALLTEFIEQRLTTPEETR
ncbi:type I polyketide synthase [Streptomyces sp. IB2014 016-6]|uniref:type I polyketide synthase n=1 Tax=Streptomyces sp. IB2014 016-6 TaxID=2517818 RepID=UPI0011C92B7D|nr:type I polyketide synthase [Streptomyces sp. IB2014 016-6]TXL85782.1 SDR family NAD(P)-dependent oxidoreductase [Streptomyces sp. IB2014 016-6]